MKCRGPSVRQPAHVSGSSPFLLEPKQEREDANLWNLNMLIKNLMSSKLFRLVIQ